MAALERTCLAGGDVLCIQAPNCGATSPLARAAARLSQGGGNDVQINSPTLTVPEVAELTGFSRATVTRMFEREPGVLILSRPEKMHKRKYRSIRIPRAVYERVLRRLQVR